MDCAIRYLVQWGRVQFIPITRRRKWWIRLIIRKEKYLMNRGKKIYA